MTVPDKAGAGARVVVIVSANTEWRVTQAILGIAATTPSPYGAWVEWPVTVAGQPEPVVFLHGGWGKIAAAGSAQYAIDRWQPELLVNLGTCGGFEGAIERGTIFLAARTLVYDIIEQMGSQAEALLHYATDLDLAWVGEPPPTPVTRGLLLSADRDIVAEEVPRLQAEFGGVAADWESGAIAYVAVRNGVRCLILRGVTDLVGPDGGEAYDGTVTLFKERAEHVMRDLLAALPAWLERARRA